MAEGADNGRAGVAPADKVAEPSYVVGAASVSV